MLKLLNYIHIYTGSDKITQKTIQHYLIIPDLIFQVEFNQLQNFFVRFKDFTCNKKTSFRAFDHEQKYLAIGKKLHLIDLYAGQTRATHITTYTKKHIFIV